MTAWHTTEAPFPPDHPSLPGHFPGNPVIPGVLILERVIDCLIARHPGMETSEIVSAKFLHPLRPGEPFTIHYQERAGETGFECRAGESVLSSGRVKLVASGDPV